MRVRGGAGCEEEDGECRHDPKPRALAHEARRRHLIKRPRAASKIRRSINQEHVLSQSARANDSLDGSENWTPIIGLDTPRLAIGRTARRLEAATLALSLAARGRAWASRRRSKPAGSGQAPSRDH